MGRSNGGTDNVACALTRAAVVEMTPIKRVVFMFKI